ncbi:MAG TPA: hypothetical protein VG456_17195, partial [Candidatus Sulfopaludibacter sp.]|nr:hypothetical protein [Candidatus Sulfopaludibacter sp.]
MSKASATSRETSVFSQNRAMLGYVAPFLTYVGFMAVEHGLGISSLWAYGLRLAAVVVVLVLFSRPYLSFRPSMAVASIGIGIAVFCIWIGPDLLFGYRH